MRRIKKDYTSNIRIKYIFKMGEIIDNRHRNYIYYLTVHKISDTLVKQINNIEDSVIANIKRIKL